MRSGALNLQGLATKELRAATSPPSKSSALSVFFCCKSVFVILMLCWVGVNVIRGQDLYAIERDGLYGFADRSGTPVVPPTYRSAGSFREGLAAVNVNGRWGYIDRQGKLKIEPRFHFVHSFSDGFAAVAIDALLGYIDSSGRVVIEPRYSQAGQFSEGVAPVRDRTGWLYIDRAGNNKFDRTFIDARSFSEGLAGVATTGWKFGFIDSSGKDVISPDFANVRPFAEGLAAVQVRATKSWGYINKSGEYVIPPIFKDAEPFSEGLAAVLSTRGWGYINRNGGYVIDPAFEGARRFSEGLAAVRLADRWGYINKNGEIRIPNNFPFFADEFVGGLALVSDPIRGAQIYIDSAGKARFLMSGEQRGGPAAYEPGMYVMSSLELRSEPPGADVYLIPAYIWDQRNGDRPAPSQLEGSTLRDYLKEHFDFRVQEGQTNVKARVIEQNYVALFFLADDMKRLWLDIRQGDNSASVSFGHR